MKKRIHLLLVCLLLTFSGFAQTVYKTKTGEKYHEADCRYLKSVIETTVTDARAEGLTACSVCRPPAATTTSLKSDDTSDDPEGDESISERSYTSVQCSGTTKAGNRCKRVTRAVSGRCYQH